ncbi:MAG: polysaccharide biosynthesis protein [Eubacteriales bacterium]|nr:polysaccharide biosynthesis protein [Eubacteriales bacterium]
MQDRKGYMHGAILLLISGCVVKLLGALFKIPLTNLIGDSGMGMFSFAMQFFSILFVVCAAGIPVAESYLVSESLALGKAQQARRMVCTTTIVFTLISILFAAGLALGADELASLFGEPEAGDCLVAIAPAVVLVTIEAGLRGWYQGTGNMEPTSTSQVLEAVGKLLFGLLLARRALYCGFGIPGAAAGAVLGVTAGELIAVLYLIWSVRHSVWSTLLHREKRVPGTVSRFLSLMIPVTLGAAVMTVSGFLDMALLYRRLPLIGFGADEITAQYGAYTGMALTLYHLPQAFSGAIAVSILPAIASAWTKKQEDTCHRLVSSSMRLTILVCIPCGAVLSVFSRPLLELLFSSQPQGIAVAEPLLACLGFTEAFVGLASVTTSVLQSIGRPDITVCTTAIGCTAKFVVSYYWMAQPEIGMMAAPLSTLVCFGVILVLNLFAIYTKMKWVPALLSPVLRISLAACMMSATGMHVYRMLLTCNSLLIALFLSAVWMCFIYFILLLVLRALHYEDVIMLPGGKQLALLLKLS